jgi:predicted transcriptional regulator
MTDSNPSEASRLELVAEIVAAYVAQNRVPVADLPALIDTVRVALQGKTPESTLPVAPAPTPAVAIKKSVRPEHIVCLECGKTFTTLKRHLRTDHELTPDGYRSKWNLPEDYPMVAPSYAARRSELALAAGLGQRRKAEAEA